MEKRFNVFLTEDTHRLIKATAYMNGEKMNDYIVKAIMEQLKKDGSLKIK